MRPVWSRRVGVGIFGGITAGTFCLGVWQAKRLSWKEGEVSYASGFWLAHRGGACALHELARSRCSPGSRCLLPTPLT